MPLHWPADHAETSTADSPMQGRLEGRARIREVYVSWFASFPDLVFTSKALVIDGDRVAQFVSIRGTQSAPFGGVLATGRRFEINGALLFTIGPEGLFVHEQRFYDVTGMLVQLGVLKGKPVDV
jgi:predicted ester cyclase